MTRFSDYGGGGTTYHITGLALASAQYTDYPTGCDCALGGGCLGHERTVQYVVEIDQTAQADDPGAAARFAAETVSGFVRWRAVTVVLADIKKLWR